MGAILDRAMEHDGLLIRETALLFADSSTPEVDEPDAPVGSVYFRSNGDRYTRTADTGSGVAVDWVREDPDAISGGGSLQGSWKFSTTITDANPGSGRLRYNNATPASVTKLFINDTTNAGFDISNIFNNILAVGDKFYMQQADTGANFLIVTIDTITDNTGWFTLDVTVGASGSLPQNNRDIGVVIFTAGGGGSTPGDQGVVQARRTTDQLFTAAWVDVPLDDTVVENDAATVEHDAITDRITLKDPGLYWIESRVDAETDPILSANSHSFVRTRVRVNDGGADLPGSLCQSTAWEDGSINGDGTQDAVLVSGFPYTASADDFITLQIQQTETDLDAVVNAAGNRVTLSAVRMTGERGSQGPTGSGGATLRVGHTYAISGEIKVPAGQTDFVVPFFVSLAGGQTAELVKARHKINAGTSVTCKLQKNDVDITGFTSISVTTTAADTDPTDVTLADNDKIALVVTAVAGTPQNMSFTIFIEVTN